MLIDVMNSDSYINFNITLAQLFGLKTAIYCSEILNIYHKALHKDKLIDKDFIKVDRKYILNRTTLSIEDQLLIDGTLLKIKLIKKQKDNPDIISIDIDLLMAMMADEKEEDIKEIKKRTHIIEKEERTETKKQKMINELKNNVVCSNHELLSAIWAWIDVICNNPKYGWLSAKAVAEFKTTLDNYTKGDLDKALSIVKIATIQCYRDCQWAINTYEKDQQLKTAQREQARNRLITKVRVTEQRKGTVDTVNKLEAF